MFRGRARNKDTNIFPTIDLARYPAKTYLRPDGVTTLGRTVIDHCQIVGEVARSLVARYPKKLGEQLFPVDAAFAAACHDIGKISPCFVEKLRRASKDSHFDLHQLDINPNLERQWGGHAGVSQVAAKAMDAPRWLPEILGQHHGFSPQLGSRRADDETFGGPTWQDQRQALVAELNTRLGMGWPRIQSAEQARLVAGLTSVADWIGSGQHFEDPAQPWADQIERALSEAGFVTPEYRTELSFQQIFGFETRAAQQQLIDSAKTPGVYVLEAPMGLGKTEAALYVAYCLLTDGHAQGIYFALPTQLTSNKIYHRFNEFLEQILTPECPHRALLLHANAWLLDTEMGEEGRPGGAWFQQSKRGLLAPFAVGTIDQALMAAMNVKHGFVRAFGLAGKVVILDEIHTYDAYTSTLLDALVALLRELHCTVIILSATLNQSRRQQLLGTGLSSSAYPLITAAGPEGVALELPVTMDAGNEIAIQLLQDESLAVTEALDRAAQGQQVLWIENTVKDAQQRYLDLAARAAELGVACGLLHSRFTATDRRHIEELWVDLFGKPGWGQRAGQGRILVGTQVLEQSLDIDADFLITRFAPSDMLLQRLGRLWRHTATPRPASAVCESWLLAPDLTSAVESPHLAFGGSAYVYSPYVLCRSLEEWQGRTRLSLPHDIRAVIEATYVSRPEQDNMARWLHELDHGTPRRKGRLALHQLARIGLAEDGKTLPESKAQTRYSESDTHEVLLLRDLVFLPDEGCTRIRLLDGQVLKIPKQRTRLTKREWKQLTAKLMQQVVPVRPSEAPSPLPRHTLEKFYLQHCFYLGDPNWAEDQSLLRLALVDECSSLQGVHGSKVHENYLLEYRNDLGYRVIKP